jgi:hypothetical protein
MHAHDIYAICNKVYYYIILKYTFERTNSLLFANFFNMGELKYIMTNIGVE